MRNRRRDGDSTAGLYVGEDARYCVLCETYMMFEQVSADDRPFDGEWICVTCGSAVFVDPPTQGMRRREQSA